MINRVLIAKKQCEPFKLLTEEELVLINNNRHIAKFKAGEIIFKQGSPTSHIVSFSDGLAKIYLETDYNKDVIITLVEPTSLIGGPGIYLDGRHIYSLSALKDSTVCFIDVNVFKEIFRANSDFAEQIIRDISLKDVRLMQKLVNLSVKQSHGRIADILLYLSNNIFKTDKFDILLSRQEIADFTGMSKEGAIRILKEFQSEKIIKCNAQNITIIDKKKLIEINQIG
ncbi:MAG: Crp/Fnr family transcriptional regulator [Bacteroidales bacterium]|nr:Crp/Fnr family transcriptional regulator [Bacteroidales bacterium]MBN2756423.1 Crp/Fnr family transcriptional regulator [Bacteroidales bacterium]